MEINVYNQPPSSLKIVYISDVTRKMHIKLIIDILVNKYDEILSHSLTKNTKIRIVSYTILHLSQDATKDEAEMEPTYRVLTKLKCYIEI